MEEKQGQNTPKEKISEDIKELVIARIEVLPRDKRISIGSKGEFTTDELIEHVRKGDDVGEKIINLELTFLRALKDGTLLEEVLSSGKDQNE